MGLRNPPGCHRGRNGRHSPRVVPYPGGTGRSEVSGRARGSGISKGCNPLPSAVRLAHGEEKAPAFVRAMRARRPPRGRNVFARKAPPIQKTAAFLEWLDDL